MNNGLYQLFINTTYKQYQDGTQDGLYGYRAALADHYSQNGTYITIVLLTVWAVFLTLNGHEKKRKYIMIAGIATVIALLLTSNQCALRLSCYECPYATTERTVFFIGDAQLWYLNALLIGLILILISSITQSVE